MNFQKPSQFKSSLDTICEDDENVVTSETEINKETMMEKNENETFEEDIDFILRQTEYTREEAMYSLKENRYDKIKVIKNFILNGKPSKLEELKKVGEKSTNQKLISELRNLMDEINVGFESRKSNKTITKTI